MKNPICSLALSSVLLSIISPGCEDLGVPPHILPSVISFSAGPRNVSQGQTVHFKVSAAAERGLARGIIDFRDGTKRDTVNLSGSRDSVQTSHTYLIPGTFKPTLTVEDVSGRRATTSDSVYVWTNHLPRIISLLTGSEGSVSFAPKKVLASDTERDSLTISVSPLSPGLVFRLNASNDSVIYYLTDRDDHGSKLGIISVVDQMNRTVQKVIDIVFAPRDDISGRVRDRFEGTYLAGYKPAAVMQGPFTGWVAAITGTETVKVPVDAGGRYTFPKLSSANHTFRAFITNGRDSSFVATTQVSPGDQTFDISVETNAGTGMPLHRLLSLFQAANFKITDVYSWYRGLVGIDLKNGASGYTYYLVCKDTTTKWFNARRLTAEQQDWIVAEIQARCFVHFLPANRPRIVKGGPNDPLPLREAFIGGIPTVLPYSGYTIIYANPVHWRNDVTVWDERYDGSLDGAQIALDGGDASAPPYGFSISALVQMVGKTISGNGPVPDPYYNDKSTRAENTVLDTPSIADMKLDWQVVFETPRDGNNVEARYFQMPE